VSPDPGKKGQDILQKVATQALADADYRKRLIDDPRSVLREAGLVVPDELEVVIHQNREDVLHLVLPSPLEAAEQLAVDELNVAYMLTTHF
jgi:Nitrile hydratase, alpha chain